MSGILVIGSMNYDITYAVDDFPEFHSKIRARESWAGPGGSAANTAYLLGRGGSTVRMLGFVGADPLGDEAIRSLSSVGVDTRFVGRLTDTNTSMCTILVGRGDKRMVTGSGASRRLTSDSLGPEMLAGMTHVHLATGDVDLIDKTLRLGGQNGVTTSLEWNGRDFRNLASHATVNFMNRDELQRLDPNRDHRRAASRIICADEMLLAVTDGARGAWLAGRKCSIELPVPRSVNLVDRTGGGDAFNAGFLQGWTRGKSPENCLAQGLMLACELLETRGTRPL